VYSDEVAPLILDPFLYHWNVKEASATKGATKVMLEPIPRVLVPPLSSELEMVGAAEDVDPETVELPVVVVVVVVVVEGM
jgi:hypothetical protein